MNKKTGYYILSFLLVGIVIYLYFLKWKTDTIYGDDLSIFINHANSKTLWEKINIAISFGKFRPVYGISYHTLIGLFQANTDYYYLFNIGIQTINTFILAQILNLFLRSYWWSVSFSLLYGLSRFSYFNISQLFNGGVLEGLAITFFLMSLFYIIKTLTNDTLTPSQKSKNILWSVLYANLSLYTHERYIILLPFIVILVLGYPRLRSLSIKYKTTLCLAAIGSIFLNVAIKKYALHVPFFVGTGGTNIEFSFFGALSFFIDGVLSILQINSGPDYLVGLQFSALSLFGKTLVIIPVICLIIIFLSFFFRSVKAYIILFLSKILDTSILKQRPDMPQFVLICFFLFCLFALNLVPAVMTIRLEQRWLQASLIVFILIVVILMNSIRFKNDIIKYATFGIFNLLFLWNDYNYLNRGGGNIYISNAERLAVMFKDAIDKDVLHKKTTMIFIWSQKRDVNGENDCNWITGAGNIFGIYQNKSKKIVFVDSVYERTHSGTDTAFSHFDKNTDQLVYFKNGISDITNEFLKDSLKTFKFE